MKGIEIFYQKCEKSNIKLTEVSTDKGSLNGKLSLTYPNGFTIDTSINQIADMYGSLTFFHLGSEEAIDNVLEVLVEGKLQREWFANEINGSTMTYDEYKKSKGF